MIPIIGIPGRHDKTRKSIGYDFHVHIGLKEHWHNEYVLEFYQDMEKNIGKFILGSDWPGMKTISSNIEILKELPMTEESLKKILYRNAAQVLRL